MKPTLFIVLAILVLVAIVFTVCAKASFRIGEKKHRPISNNCIHFRAIPNQSFSIKGKISETSNKFIINLCRVNDVLLHFNPRFADNNQNAVIVCNSKKGNANWGTEHRVTNNFPFNYNTEVEVVFTLTSTGVNVKLPNNHTFTFSNSAASDGIDRVCVEGNFTLTEISLINSNVSSYPSLRFNTAA